MTGPERSEHPAGREPEPSRITSTVDVGIDPAAAFAVFTGELDLWWVRGPINHHDGGRLRAIRCEPGVGGRLLEVYDKAGDDVLELARITVWEPGRRVAWRSSIDDVSTEVTFAATASGTTVTVVATIAAGGQDRGGTSWTRVVPKWFGPWCGRRDHAPHEVRDLARLALTVSYARPAAAARWLAQAFGFTSPDPLPDGDDPLPRTAYGHPWIEFRLGDSSLVIAERPDGETGASGAHLPWVYVDDVAAHCERARAGGAVVVTDLASPWGLPFYVAADCEGLRWTFAQARPTMR